MSMCSSHLSSYLQYKNFGTTTIGDDDFYLHDVKNLDRTFSVPTDSYYYLLIIHDDMSLARSHVSGTVLAGAFAILSNLIAIIIMAVSCLSFAIVLSWITSILMKKGPD